MLTISFSKNIKILELGRFHYKKEIMVNVVNIEILNELSTIEYYSNLIRTKQYSTL